jgi:hypothetical protein
MKTNRITLWVTILLAGLFFQLKGQDTKVISITDPGELYSTYNFTTSDQEALVKTLGQEKFTIIKGASHETQWPSGISNLEARTEKRELIMKYHINVVAALGEKSVIEINPANNKHMPAEMISAHSFYFVIGNSGIGNPGAGDETVTSNAEELLEDIFPQVSIDDPGQILSNYKFQESEIKDIKNQVGDEGFDYINANCREASFPKSINTLSGRLASRDEIMKYNAFLVAESGDFSILEITPEENTHMPEGFVPENTFYLVIKSAGISFLE